MGGITYFLITRKIFDSPIWRDDPHILKLFIYLIGEARHSKEPRKYSTCVVKRGELLTSLSQIRDANEFFKRGIITKWSRAKVSRMLNYLEKQGYIELLPDTFGTHISICNYDYYQTKENYKTDSSETVPDSSETVVRTNKNDKKGKNEKKYTTPPTPPKEGFVLPEWFPKDLWKMFLSHRKGLKAPIKKESYALILKKFQ
ncbi:MAG: hypothetical protein GXO89_15005, partial [Chlorobi bacterium]|nr:hypothetical protein [Chlorobiota bacterium]